MPHGFHECDQVLGLTVCMDSEFWLTAVTYRDISVELHNAMEPPNKKLCSSLRGTATAAVHGDVLALEEGDVPAWVFSLSQDWDRDWYRSVMCQSADMMKRSWWQANSHSSMLGCCRGRRLLSSYHCARIITVVFASLCIPHRLTWNASSWGCSAAHQCQHNLCNSRKWWWPCDWAVSLLQLQGRFLAEI